MRFQRLMGRGHVIALCTLLCVAGNLHAQSIDWTQKHGSKTSGYAVQRLDDGGFIAVGGGGEWPYFEGYLVRTDTAGKQIFEKKVGGGNTSVLFQSVKKLADGGFVVVGTRQSQPYMWKFSATGAEVWAKPVMGSEGYGSANAVVTTPNGIFVTGYNFFAAKYNVFVQGFNQAGDSLWSLIRSFKGSRGSGIRQALDGDLVIAGQADGPGGKDAAYLLKVTTNGGFVWEKTYEEFGGDYAMDVAVGSDGFLAVGSKSPSAGSSDANIDIIKTKLDGTLEWRKQLTSSGYNGANAVRPTLDGYIIVGYEGTSMSFKAHAIKIDKSGTVKYDIEVPGATYLHYVDQAVPPSKFVVVGGDGSQLVLARINEAGSLPPVDAKTFVYYYDNTPKVGLKSGQGWVGAGPGKIKLAATSKDTIVVNGQAKLALTSFTLDTTRASATGKMKFTGIGTLLATGPKRSDMQYYAGGPFSGWIDNRGLGFDVPMRSDEGKGLFGTSMAVREIFVQDYPTTGRITLSGDIRMPGYYACWSNNDKEIEFAGLDITPTTLTLAYLEATRTEPGVCLININPKTYNAQADELVLHGEHHSSIYFGVQLPVITSIKGGMFTDMSLEPKKDETPLAKDTNYVVEALNGYYKTWYLNFWGTQIPMGYAAFINGTLRAKNFFQVYLNNAAIIAPGTLYAGATNFTAAKVGDLYHIGGKADIKVEWNGGYTSFEAVDGVVNAGNLAPGVYVFEGTGSVYAKAKGIKPTYVNGEAVGTVTIPDLTKYNINLGAVTTAYMAMLPVGTKVPAKVTFQDKLAHLEFQGVYADLPKMTFDFTKAPSAPGFLTVHLAGSGLGGILDGILGAGTKKPRTSAEASFTVPANTHSLWVQVAGAGAIAPTTLVTPSGTEISAPTTDSAVRKVTVSGTEYWWFVRTPEAGAWKISKTAGQDTVRAYVIANPAPFEVTAAQSGKDVTVSWTNAATDTVDVFLDANGEGEDGIYMASALPGSKSITFTVTDDLPDCSYHVYAIQPTPIVVQRSYAANVVTNDKAFLRAPSNIAVSYDATAKTATLMWDSVTDGSVAGLLIRVTGNGVDTAIARLNGTEKSLTFPVTDPAGYFVSVMAYDTNGTRGCWSARLPISTSNVGREYVRESIEAVVLPNPSVGKSSLYLNLTEGANVRISIFDAAGRSMSSPDARYQPAGESYIELPTSELPSGSYVIMIEAGDRMQVRNLVISR